MRIEEQTLIQTVCGWMFYTTCVFDGRLARRELALKKRRALRLPNVPNPTQNSPTHFPRPPPP